MDMLREEGKRREREGGREREKHPCETETWIGCLLDVPRLGMKSAI